MVIIDRDVSYGNEGAVCSEVRGSLYGLSHPPTITNFIAGLGGSDVTPQEIEKVVRGAVELKDSAERSVVFQFIGENK